MEKAPKFRVVGNVSEETKSEAKKELQKMLFEEKHLETIPKEKMVKLESLEYKKTAEELELIDFANKKVSELMVSVGVVPYDVPARNIHIVPPELYKEIVGKNNALASTAQRWQVIICDAGAVKSHPLQLAKISFHELIHLKGHLSLEVEESASKKGKKIVGKTQFRGGLRVGSAQKMNRKDMGHEHFRGLNEAVTAAVERKFIESALDLPRFSKEKAWLSSSEALGIKKKLAKEKNIPEGEISWVDRDGKKFGTISYPHQREVLYFVLQEIQKEFPEKYRSADEVMPEFLKGLFGDTLIPVGRLVEGAFGSGSFRVLGMMGPDRDTAVTVMEYLRGARRRVIRQKNAK